MQRPVFINVSLAFCIIMAVISSLRYTMINILIVLKVAYNSLKVAYIMSV